ncbi:uncharacterized protein LOC134538613 [Bacillus rossius redtenbacheri]|uniref:uncharacterized protein LOC134538613 n=1 Tax=Bacillus rossius redtenbacheri TaxID=93214 RepID=UPI002FDD3BE8
MFITEESVTVGECRDMYEDESPPAQIPPPLIDVSVPDQITEQNPSPHGSLPFVDNTPLVPTPLVKPIPSPLVDLTRPDLTTHSHDSLRFVDKTPLVPTPTPPTPTKRRTSPIGSPQSAPLPATRRLSTMSPDAGTTSPPPAVAAHRPTPPTAAARHPTPPPQRYVLTPPDSSHTLDSLLARPDSSPTPCDSSPCDSSPTSCITTLPPPGFDIILPPNRPATPGVPMPTRRLIDAPPPGFDAIMSPDCPATSPPTAPVDAATPRQHTPQATSVTKTQAAQPSAQPTPTAKHQPVSEAEHSPRLLPARNEPPDRSHPTRRPAPWPPPIQSRYRHLPRGTAGGLPPPG